MPARFRLSNRQSKSLDRGAMLRIALPAPLAPVQDLFRFVRESLPDVPPSWLGKIGETEIVVSPTSSGDGTPLLLGRIIHDAESLPEDWLTLVVRVVVVEICQREKPREKARVQWPGEWVGKETTGETK